MKQTIPAALSALALALAAGSAHAQIVNGQFASGLAGWTTAGDAASVATGGAHLVLTNAFSDGLDDSLTDGRNHNVSGNDPWPAVGGPGSLEDFLGLPGGALDTSPLAQSTEGSATTQVFDIVAGGTLTFQWNFGTTETDPGLADRAFVVIDGQLITLASTLAGKTGTDFGAETGWQSFSQALAAGAHTIAFGVVDIGSTADSSALSVADVTLGVSAVPESSMLALMGAGLAMLAFVRRRRSV